MIGIKSFFYCKNLIEEPVSSNFLFRTKQNLSAFCFVNVGSWFEGSGFESSLSIQQNENKA